ncbi:hypothetical protein IMY05_006G0099700 [Salix suchowensis]|nr:hypothetical protein IMY05_006G0099700 [Salix suchowensis]
MVSVRVDLSRSSIVPLSRFAGSLSSSMRSHALFFVFFTVGGSCTTPLFWSLRVIGSLIGSCMVCCR